MGNLGLGLAVCAALFLSACGGGTSGSLSNSGSSSGSNSGGPQGGSSTPVVLTITPSDVYLDPGEMIQFQVTQSPNQGLPLTYQAMTVGGPKVAGSVTNTGLYTASPDPWDYQLVVSAKTNGVTVAT